MARIKNENILQIGFQPIGVLTQILVNWYRDPPFFTEMVPMAFRVFGPAFRIWRDTGDVPPPSLFPKMVLMESWFSYFCFFAFWNRHVWFIFCFSFASFWLPCFPVLLHVLLPFLLPVVIDGPRSEFLKKVFLLCQNSACCARNPPTNLILANQTVTFWINSK